jgi:8-oxo-dGTP pyrophosphatase MutT (NUDIX family)
METTRHFTATTFVVHDGATLLHDHDRLDMWLPPGGHLERDERPREAARREVREETGLAADLLEPETDVVPDFGRELPPAEHVMLYDVDRLGDAVAHQHVDFVYYGVVEDRALNPDDGEAVSERWEWFNRDDLRAHDGLTDEVVALGREAIERVASRRR